MRFSLATMSCAAALALLAGCSSSQNAATLPSSGVGAQAHQGGAAPDMLHGKMTPMKLLELQAAGKLPGFGSRKGMEAMLKYYQSHPHQQFRAHRTSPGVSVWATNPEYSYLVGMNKSTKKVVTYAYTGDYGAYDPITVKVDHSQNAWVANEDNSSYNGGAVQEYSSTGSYESIYSFTSYCPVTGAYCYGYGLDSAENSSNVFAGNPYWYYDYCTTVCTFDTGSGIYKFTAGNPSSGSTFYPFSDKNQNLNCEVFSNYDYGCDEVYYMDVDSSGNVWFDFYNEFSGAGLAELTSGGSYNVILAAGTYGFPGSVYVSNSGSVLNVTDQDTRTTYQYHLPVTSSSSPFATFGPTATNVQGFGDPIGGGMDSTDSKMIFGDEYGWLDRCAIAGNKCKAVANINFPGGSSGAAYTPSDK